MFHEKHYIINEDALTFFFDANAIFCRHEYFSKQLWRKVKGFEKEDEAEVKCAFLSSWAKETMNIVTYPVGAAWCTMYGKQEYFDDYIKKYKPLFKDYGEWCMMQR